MTEKRAAPYTLLYTLGLVALLFLMAVVPSWLRRSYYELPEGQSSLESQSPVSFEISRNFPLLVEGIPKGASSFASWSGKGRRPGGAEPVAFLVNFWATWCPPCLEELPSLEMLGRQLQQSGDPRLPRLVTVSVDDTAQAVQNLWRTLDFKPSFPVFHDPEGQYARSVGTVRFPETYLISSEGKVLYKWVGPQNWLSGDFVRRLQSLLALK